MNQMPTGLRGCPHLEVKYFLSRDPNLRKDFFDQLIQELLIQGKGRQCYLYGYSMGGRILAECLPHIQQLTELCLD